jgi:hypothetical protein
MTKIPKEIAAWTTPEGYLDLNKFPIEPGLRQSLDEDPNLFRSGVMLLQSMARNGRNEAGVYLLGLMDYYADDLERLKVVVEGLGAFHCRQAVSVLVSEFYRIESSNATRGYLNEVLKALGRFPKALAEAPLLDLASDKKFSYRMRRKFEVMASRFQERDEWFRCPPGHQADLPEPGRSL